MATTLNLSVIKAFDALDLLDEARPELTADAVARELQLSGATAHRFLATLEAAGVLTAVRRGAYAPGPRLARLGRMAEELAPLPAALQSTLDDLRQALGESVMACRYTPRGPLCVAVSLAQRPVSVQIRTGTTLPMTNTAQGRLFLAAMAPREPPRRATPPTRSRRLAPCWRRCALMVTRSTGATTNPTSLRCPCRYAPARARC